MRFDLFDVVMKLNGPVQPVGDSGVDAYRLSHIEALTELVDKLLGEISQAATSATRHEASMKAIGGDWGSVEWLRGLASEASKP